MNISFKEARIMAVVARTSDGQNIQLQPLESAQQGAKLSANRQNRRIKIALRGQRAMLHACQHPAIAGFDSRTGVI
ncbi:hypothetical protein [Pseudomonas cichorii]|uniref:hypothetical protein n=1 Tax=Pseudomonas cichorii TaxID=36746 RepID=UPI000EFE0A40|nr:hypothetical protein [Pseudomonas cichorii]